MSISNITKIETAMKEHELILNMNIDKNIDNFKSEASISINKKFSILN